MKLCKDSQQVVGMVGWVSHMTFPQVDQGLTPASDKSVIVDVLVLTKCDYFTALSVSLIKKKVFSATQRHFDL